MKMPLYTDGSSDLFDQMDVLQKAIEDARSNLKGTKEKLKHMEELLNRSQKTIVRSQSYLLSLEIVSKSTNERIQKSWKDFKKSFPMKQSGLSQQISFTSKNL